MSADSSGISQEVPDPSQDLAWQGWLDQESLVTTSVRPDITGIMASTGLGRNIFLSIVARLATFVISFPLGIFIARILGPHDRGVYALILLITVLFTYCTLGISSAGIYAVGRGRHSLDEVVSNVLLFGLLISGILGLLYALIAFVLPISAFATVPIYIRLLTGVVGICMLLSTYMSDCLLAAQDIDGYNVSNVMQVLIQAGGLALFLILTRHSLFAAAASYGLGVALSLVAEFVFIMRRTRIHLAVNGSLLRGLFHFGLRSYVTSVLNLGNLRLDTVLVSIFVSITAVGYYSVATTLSEMIWQVPLIMGTILFPAASALSAHSGAYVIARACRRALLLVLICLIIFFFGGYEIVKVLYGTAYLPSVSALWLLLPGAIGFTVYKVLYSYLLGNGKPSVGVASTAISLACTVILDLLLIPRLGINGAAITSSIAYCLNGIVVLFAFVRFSRVNPLLALVPTPADAIALIRQGLRSISGGLRKVRPKAHQGHGNTAITPRTGPGLLVPTGIGIVFGLWIMTATGRLNPILFLLGIIAGMALLTFVDRFWLAAAMLAADLTLTDFPVPLPGSPSIRVVLGVLLIYVLLLSFAQDLATLGGSTKVAIGLVVVFLGIATFSNVINHASAGQFLSHSAAGLAVMLYLACLVQTKHDLQLVGVAGIFIAVLSALLAIVQAVLHSSVSVASASALAAYQGQAFGLAQTPISLGNGLAIAIALIAAPLLFGRLPRSVVILGWLLVSVLLIGIWLSGSRSALLAIGAEMTCFILAFQSRWRWLLLVCLLAIGVFGATRIITPQSGQSLLANRSSREAEISSSERLVLWEAGLLIVRDHPLLGIGYGNFQEVSIQYRERVSPALVNKAGSNTLGTFPPHNDFLNMWISFGIFGFLAFIALHVFAFWSAWTTMQRTTDVWIRAVTLGCMSGLAAYCVHEFVHNGYDDTLVLWILVGAILALGQLVKFQRGRTAK